MLKLSTLLLVLLTIRSRGEALADQFYKFGVNCSETGSYPQNSNYQFILNNLLDNFISQGSNSGFYNSSILRPPDGVYGLYMCRGDILGQECSGCISEAKDTLLRSCPYQFDAVIWLDRCMVRYSNQSFFGELAESPIAVMYNTQNVTGNQTRFAEIVERTMSGLADETADDLSGMKYGTRVVNVSQSLTLYALEQCTFDLTKSDCKRCLTNAIELLKVFAQGSLAMLPSCNVRFETEPFFGSPTAEKQNRSRHSSLRVKVSIIVVSSVFIAVLFSIFCIRTCTKKRKAAETYRVGREMDEITTVDSLQFDWNTIKGATRNFSVDNKLGEGGFGQVYKGRLEDGQEVAVKRLSKNSGQGDLEFKTEIIVVAKLQHNNLVKLLGFCLTPNEKILVYEYLPHSSLDRFLSDKEQRSSMVWEIRSKIIVGVARGLMYLHEDSRLKIIHRDLKSSNILLDEAMNAKIADFGLAKLFGVDQTQGDTKRIVGTYGYMAPEYAMTGHFSVKSDVYSFGVILLEIVSGQRNRFFGRPQLEEAVLHRAWRLWNEGSPLDLADTSLGHNYPKEEVTKCIHIGLLCIQDNAIERPRMTSVVAALNSQSTSLPMPKAPTFFGVPRTTESSVHYDELTGKDDVGYHQDTIVGKDCSTSHIYTGTEGTTEFYPR